MVGDLDSKETNNGDKSGSNNNVNVPRLPCLFDQSVQTNSGQHNYSSYQNGYTIKGCRFSFQLRSRLEFVGEGVERCGIDATGTERVSVDPAYFRPTEVDELLGNPNKAKSQLGWSTKVSLKEMIRRMVRNDMYLAEREVN